MGASPSLYKNIGASVCSLTLRIRSIALALLLSMITMSKSPGSLVETSSGVFEISISAPLTLPKNLFVSSASNQLSSAK